MPRKRIGKPRKAFPIRVDEDVAKRLKELPAKSQTVNQGLRELFGLSRRRRHFDEALRLLRRSDEQQ
jgi:hypothetical protein